MAARINWGFVRDAWRAGLNYDDIIKAGYGGVLFRGDEPNLDQLMAKARKAGLKAGVWGAPGNMGPEEFARYMASMSRYNPDIYVPDIEAPGKGYQGSSGWDYNERFANRFRQLAPNAYAAVTMEPMQDDYNYKAYGSRGFEIWPQAYNGAMSPFDAKAVYDRVAANGVDPNSIYPVLMPGQQYSGYGSYYTLDDMVGKGYQRPWFPDGSEEPVGPGLPPQGSPLLGGATVPMKIPDRYNPGAVKYAKKRLAQAVKAGLVSEVPKGDPTAAWREVSKLVNPAAAEAGVKPGVLLRYGRPRGGRARPE